jgi:putative Holliday junction resolvase
MTSDTPGPPGRRLGVDVGSVRVGVAVSDAEGRLAVPLETVARGPGDLDRLADLATENDAVEVVVGLPVSLDGTERGAAASVREFATRLATVLAVPVRLVDERLTTSAAHRELAGGGADSRRRRSLVDASAAAMILQTALDAERSTGEAPGVQAADPRTDQEEA